MKKAVQTDEKEFIWVLFPYFFINLISLDWVASLADIGYYILIYDAYYKNYFRSETIYL